MLFFCYFDEVRVFRAHIGDDYKVVLSEEAFFEQMADAVFAAELLVGDEGEADFIFRRESQLLQGAERVERRDEFLPVVAGTAPIDAAVLDFGLEGVGVPQ